MNETIQRFVEEKELALVGVSGDKTKWGSYCFKKFKNRGFSVFPVNPKLKDFEGTKCFASLEDIPSNVTNAVLAVGDESALKILENLQKTSIRRVWLSAYMDLKNLKTKETLESLKSKGIEFITNTCPMMYLDGKGFHGFHRWIHELSGNKK